MIIRVEVEHAIAKGKESQALAILQELNRRGLERPADANWRGLLLQGEFDRPEVADHCREDLAGLGELLHLLAAPAKIRVHLSS